MSKEEARKRATRGFFAACLAMREMHDYLDEASGDWFPSEEHKEVFNLINEWSGETAVSRQSFYSWINHRFAEQEIPSYVTWARGLVGMVDEFAVGKAHFKTLKECARSDRLAIEAAKLQKQLEATESPEALEDFLKKIEATEFESDSLGPTWRDDLTIGSEFMEYLRRGQEHFFATGQELIENQISTGFPTLDRLMGGMQPGRMIIVGARPSVGKSVTLLEFALATARQGKKGLFVCLEMGRHQSMKRVLSNWSDTPLDDILRRQIPKAQWDRIIECLDHRMAELHENMQWTESKQQSLRTIRQAAREKKKSGLDVLFVDYLQLVKADGADAAQPMHVKVGNVSRGLKLLALELDICVVAAAQLNRDLDKGDAKPQLYHLKDSGSIEQDADQVLLMERPELYDKHDKAAGVEMFLRKNRHGPTGYLLCSHKLSHCQIKEPSPLNFDEIARLKKLAKEWDEIGT